MARIGISPTRKQTSAYRPEPVTVVVLVHIPHLEGYFTQRLDILKAVLQAVVQHTAYPHDLLVFNNGSCPEVGNYLEALRHEGAVDYLLGSHRNIGQFNAIRMAFEAAPGEYVAYVEDDVLLYPGWLQAEMAVLEAFPEAGMVSGTPVRMATQLPHNALETWLQNPPPDVEVRRGRFVPDAWEADWAESTGRDPAGHLAATQDWEDLVLVRNGVEAFSAAAHFQFLSPKEVALRALPEGWFPQLMGPLERYDEAIDRMGRLRLATMQRYARHLGNALTPALRADLEALGIELTAPAFRPRERPHWLLRIPGSGRLLWPLYRYLFRVLHNVE